MTSLIERLEAAQAGSRDLSDEVLRTLGHDIDKYGWWKPPDSNHYSSEARPCPTTNLQHAVDLVPEGYHWKEILVLAIELLNQWHPYPKPQTLDMFRRAICAVILRAKEAN